MKNKNAGAIILGIVLCFYSSVALCKPLPKSLPLPQAVTQAQLIAVAQLVEYTSVRVEAEKLTLSQIVENPHIVLLPGDPIKQAGDYKFKILKSIAGPELDTIQVKLPGSLTYFYGLAHVKLEIGSTVLLLLRKGGSGQWMPVDHTLPFIPLVYDPQGTEEHQAVGNLAPNKPGDNHQSLVIQLMLFGINDSVERKAVAYLLRDVVNDQIPKALLPYAKDPDIDTLDYILSCLATNQQIMAIPLIADLQAKVARTKYGTPAVMKLATYNTPEAIPYLNVLLFRAEEFTRVNAMSALQRLANKSSIPYLMIALSDPSEEEITYGAYAALHDLIPALGAQRDTTYFYAHQEAELRPISRWWKAELEGRHLKSIAPQAPSLNVPQERQGALAYLHSHLFDPHLVTRQHAMLLLKPIANQSSVPYLILSLKDADIGIAYEGYAILHRLIGKLDPAKDRTYFSVNRTAANKPLYDWWRDELLGKHIFGLTPNPTKN